MKLIALRVEDSVETDWKERAKASGLTLSAWIRMRCSEVEPPHKVMQNLAINGANELFYHTAASNRLTCKCQSCTDYRTRNDIPYGGFK